jgi:hypothetical protein
VSSFRSKKQLTMNDFSKIKETDMKVSIKFWTIGDIIQLSPESDICKISFIFSTCNYLTLF